MVPQKCADAERGEPECGWIAPGDSRYCAGIEVIVVVV
jgi:hypothetical protein